MVARVVLVGVLALAVMATAASAAAAAVPDTKITSGPSGLITSRSATFKFKATVSGASFQCKLDGKPWSSCTSPEKYTKLKQGGHAFRVRARKGHATDPTPALSEFTVDTVKPETTILTGPEGYTEEHSPTFSFNSSEPGTFECKIDDATFEPCASPFTSPQPLPDGFYIFRVRARDAAGNVDGTPATRAFNPETPLTEDLATADAAANLYFPDTLDMDVPSSCGGSIQVDCPGGNPVPPADQLRITSARAIQPISGQHRYDLTVTQTVQTLQPIKMTYSGANCDVTLTSGNGQSLSWTMTVQLNFPVSANTGKTYIVPSNTQLSGMENADYSLSGDFVCNFAGPFIPRSTIEDQYESWFANYWICAAPGPDYLGPCSSQP